MGVGGGGGGEGGNAYLKSFSHLFSTIMSISMQITPACNHLHISQFQAASMTSNNPLIVTVLILLHFDVLRSSNTGNVLV